MSEEEEVPEESIEEYSPAEELYFKLREYCLEQRIPIFDHPNALVYIKKMINENE